MTPPVPDGQAKASDFDFYEDVSSEHPIPTAVLEAGATAGPTHAAPAVAWHPQIGLNTLVQQQLSFSTYSGQLSPLDAYQPRWTKAAFCVSADASRHLLCAGRPIFTSHATCVSADIYYLR